MKAIVATIVFLVVIHFGMLEYRMSNYIEDAYRNNVAPLSESILCLSRGNETMADYVERAKKVIGTLSVENTKLKASLKESVTMNQELIDEKEELNEKVEMLEWKIQVLEEAIKNNGDESC